MGLDDEEALRLGRPDRSLSRSPGILSPLRSLRRPARSGLRPLLALARFAAAVLVGLLVLTPVLAPSYTRLPPHYVSLRRECDGPNPRAGCANPHDEKVFIAVILSDQDGRLAGGLWGRRVLTLVRLLGPENVFLSVYENDGGEAGRAALEAFRAQVPCRHHIVGGEHVSLARLPNVTLPDGSVRTKRVAYLAELRNRALRPLDSAAGAFDKVLFLNDIAFHPLDAAHLLFSTNRAPDGGRAQYVAACALDYFEPHRLYDVYALRDADGYASYQTLFPYFGRRGRGLSRADILAQRDAVRVRACWGGMVAAQARYVQGLSSSSSSSSGASAGPPALMIDPDRPTRVAAPVRFRHEPEPFYDACECCLFTADLAQAAASSSSWSWSPRGEDWGIYVNPYVRVAYDEAVLRWLPVVRRWERLFRLVYDAQAWFLPPAENPWRTVGEGEPFTEEVWDGDRWRLVERTGRSGLFCGVREMQVLRREDHMAQGGKRTYWVNTRMPPGQTLSFRSWWGEVLPENWREAYEAASEEEKEVFFEKDYG